MPAHVTSVNGSAVHGFSQAPALEVRLTGLRTPCRLIDSLQPRLMRLMWGRDDSGRQIRKAGVMAVVVTGGVVRAGDPLTVVLRPEPHMPLGPV